MWRSRHIGRTSERGVSLLELLIVAVLLGLFFGLVYESVIIGLRAVNASEEREALRQQMANALERLSREGSLASNVDSAEDQRFQFDADLDGDGSTEQNINYQVSGGALQRTYDGATVTLIHQVTAFDFDYTDAAGARLTTPIGSQPLRDTVQMIQVTATATNDDETLALASALYLRNN